MFATSTICVLNSLGSDESLAVPSLPSSLIDSGSASVASSSSSTSSIRRNSRKSRPCRSCSWQDASPGVVLKFASSGDSIMLLPNNLSKQDYHRFSQKLTEQQQLLLPSQQPLPRLFRSQSITSIEGHSQLMLRSLRPRSFSLSEVPTESGSGLMVSTSQDFICSQESFDEIDIGSAEDEEASTLSLMRRNSNSSKKKRFNSAGSSLSHLVPNKMLMRVSRRISSHSAADGCKCTSCHQTVTPYWRDGWAEDVMLCNACGLRFQKFAQRCHSCMYIPRKEDGVEDTCPQCQANWID